MNEVLAERIRRKLETLSDEQVYQLLDYLEFDDGFALAKIRAPRAVSGKLLGESGIRRRFGVTVVGVKEPGREFTYADKDTLIEPGALLAVSGPSESIDRFALET